MHQTPDDDHMAPRPDDEPEPARGEAKAAGGPEYPGAPASAWSPPHGDAPRKLTRSTEDKLVGGVAGGLGRYFGVDPVLFRIGFVISVFVGGFGVLAYLGLLAFLPSDEGPSFMAGRSRGATIAITAGLGLLAVTFLSPHAFFLGPGLFGLALVGAVGVLLYRAFSDEREADPARAIARASLALLIGVAALGAATGVGFAAALGGGVVIGVLAVLAGFALLVAGLLGGPRWLILPVTVLVLPLAVVSAAGIDLHGGVGHREYRPATVSDLRNEYRLGMGQLDVDLRDMTLPAGRTNVKVSVGMGEARVQVPAGACVATDAQIGVGGSDVFDRNEGGFDLDVAEAAPAGRTSVVHVDADIGVGHLQVDRGGLTSDTTGACA